MKSFLITTIIILSAAAESSAFCPIAVVRRNKSTTATTTTRRSMTLLEDWKNFFSPQEHQHRLELHQEEMEEIKQAQEEILERRGDPDKMKAYKAADEARHHRMDKKHDDDVQHEQNQEAWSGPTPKSIEKEPTIKATNTPFDNWKKYFSKQEFQHRQVEHHLEMLDTADAEQQTLDRRHDPAKMKAYKAADEARHHRMDQQHEMDVEKELSKEYVDEKLTEGDDFFGNMVKNLFGKEKSKN